MTTTRHVGPVAAIRDLKDWSKLKPPAPGWRLDERMLEGFGFLIVAEGLRQPVVRFSGSREEALRERAIALEAPGSIAVGDLSEIRRMADFLERATGLVDNTRKFLVVHDRATGEELRRVDVTALDEDLREHVTDGVRRSWRTRGDVVLGTLTTVHGREVATEFEEEAEMREWAVNVRAIVTATPTEADAEGAEASPWEVYDVEKDSEADRVRCDTLVRVRAATAEEAVELAKDEAPAVVLAGYVVDDVELWVDKEIDIDPEFATEPQADAPKP